MSRIFKIYENRIEKVWYESSNIIYSECDDVEDDLKTLRIVFKDGRQYQYDSVKVNDYLLFRENISQGKALNQFIKPNYLASRLDNVDVNLIRESVNSYQEETPNNNIEVFLDTNILTVIKNGEIIKQLTIDNNIKLILSELLETIGINFKILQNEKNMAN